MSTVGPVPAAHSPHPSRLPPGLDLTFRTGTPGGTKSGGELKYIVRQGRVQDFRKEEVC